MPSNTSLAAMALRRRLMLTAALASTPPNGVPLCYRKGSLAAWAVPLARRDPARQRLGQRGLFDPVPGSPTKVKDLKRSKNPEERDWSDAGQDQEREFFFGDALQRRLVEVTPERSLNGKSAPETGK